MLQASLINQRSHIKKKVRLWLCFSFKCFKSKLWFGVFPVQLGLCSFISQIYKYRSGPGSRPETETVIKILQLRFTMTPNIGGRVIMMRAFVHIHFVLYVLINTWKWSFKLILLPQSSCCLFFYLKYVFALLFFWLVSRITQKPLNRFPRNLGGGFGLGPE